MAERQQKRIAELFFYKIWNQRDFRLIPYLFSDNCITIHINAHEPEQKVGEPESVNRFIREWHDAFPGLKVGINRIVSDHHYISTYCTLTGMHQGTWRGIAPTHRCISIDLMMILKVVNGKVAENVVMVNYLGLYHQLGVLQHAPLPTA